jgi:hypothetical protein
MNYIVLFSNLLLNPAVKHSNKGRLSKKELEIKSLIEDCLILKLSSIRNKRYKSSIEVLFIFKGF